MTTIAFGHGAPSTDYYFDVAVASQDAPNNRSLIAVQLWAVNRGSTSTFSSNAGAQRGYVYPPGEVINHVATPFLPSGVAKDANRWVHNTSFYINHDARGICDGDSVIGFQMTLSLAGVGNFDTGVAGLGVPRIPKSPLGPTGGAVASITNSGGTYTSTANADDGGSGATSRDIQIARDGAFTVGLVGYTPGILSQAFTGLLPRTTYYVRSRVNNAIGNGDWSATTTFDTLDVPDAPSLSTNLLSPTGVTVTSANGTYTGGSITAREIVITLASDTLFASPISTNTALTNPTAFTGLTRATQYILRSRVQNSTGWSPWSSTYSVTTDSELPAAPASYSAQDITSTTAYSSMPSVSDNGGTALVDIRVEYNTAANSTGSTVQTTGGYRRPFIQGLTKGVTYYYRLAVANTGSGGGFGPYGPWVSFTTLANTPQPVASIAVSAIGNNQATVSWTAPAALNGATLTGYTLRVAADPDFANGLQTFTLGSAVLSQVVAGLLSGTPYYAQVWPTSNNGNGGYSPNTAFTTTGTAPIPSSAWARVAGVWRSGKLWLKVGGVWKQGVMWQKVGGVWRHG